MSTDQHGESLADLVQRVEQEFQSRFSKTPAVVTAAPGRVNLIGEHIDYNDGFVLPMAVEKYIVIGAAPREGGDHSATVYSINMDESATIGLDAPLEPKNKGWSDYVEGVLAGFQQLGESIPAFDAVILSNVPLGGGLSSSAALEVSTATMLEVLTGRSLDRREKALLCQKAEHVFANMPCGIMDQFSSVFGMPGELMLLDCRSQELEPIPFAAEGVSILITNSNVKHELTGSEYPDRRRQCESSLAKLGRSTWRDVTPEMLEAGRGELTDVEYRRALHVVGEIARTVEAADAFRGGDWPRAGELMYQSHASLRDDFEVSCPEIDVLVEIAQGIGPGGGVFGSRITGGGFGGCTVSLVEADKADAVAAELASQYKAKTGIDAHIFASQPARGAHIVKG